MGCGHCSPKHWDGFCNADVPPPKERLGSSWVQPCLGGEGASHVLCEPEPWWLSWDLVSKIKLSVRELTADQQLPGAVGALSRDAIEQLKTLRWPQPRIPCQPPGPSAPVSQQGSSQLPSVLPCQVQILSRPCPVPIPRKAPDVQRWGCPSASSCLHLAGVAGQVLAVIALPQQTPMGSPPHPAGPRPWQIQESNTGRFFSRKIPHAS